MTINKKWNVVVLSLIIVTLLFWLSTSMITRFNFLQVQESKINTALSINEDFRSIWGFLLTGNNRANPLFNYSNNFPEVLYDSQNVKITRQSASIVATYDSNSVWNWFLVSATYNICKITICNIEQLSKNISK